MRTLSSIPAFCLLISGLVVGCTQDEAVDPLDAYLATWMPNSNGASPIDSPAQPTPPDSMNPGAPKVDEDGDGVSAEKDCNDNSSVLGELLYIDSLDADAHWFRAPSQLSRDPWVYNGDTLAATGGGQQAVLGQARSWQNVFVFAVVSAAGTRNGCNGAPGGDTNLWRAGILARAALDSDQNEGFHGYRCGIASNASGVSGDPTAGESTGSFVQLAEFKDIPENGVSTECSDGPDPSFSELAHIGTDDIELQGDGSALLAFTAVDDELKCEFLGTRGSAVAEARTNKLASGTVGFSTLNMTGKFHFISVCAVLE